MPRLHETDMLIRCVLSLWIVALPLVATPAASGPAPGPPSTERGGRCPGCPHRETRSTCPHETPLPCRSQNSCPRGGDSPGASLFLAPAPTSLPAPVVAGPVCCPDVDTTDVAFAPPVPPPRTPASC